RSFSAPHCISGVSMSPIRSFLVSSLLLLAGVLPGFAADKVVAPGARAFGVARLKYGGGGDWYEDRTSLANLMRAARERLGISVAGDQEAVVEPGSANLFQYP